MTDVTQTQLITDLERAINRQRQTQQAARNISIADRVPDAGTEPTEG